MGMKNFLLSMGMKNFLGIKNFLLSMGMKNFLLSIGMKNEWANIHKLSTVSVREKQEKKNINC